MRPNFFVNTPDILHAYLQYGGPAAKIDGHRGDRVTELERVRRLRGCTSTWPSSPGSEEYLDSGEVPDPDPDWDKAAAEVARWRRTSPGSTRSAARTPRCSNVRIHWSDDENILVFSKSAASAGEATDTVIVVVNVDPHATRETMVHLDPALGMDWGDSFAVHDEITGEDWSWGQHSVRLDPSYEPAHILTS